MNNFAADDRETFLRGLQDQVATGEISLGQLIKQVRTEFYGMRQADFAKLCGVSDKTLRDLEKGNTDPRVSVLQKALRPCGFQVGASMIPRRVVE